MSWPPARRSASIARIDAPPLDASSDGQRLVTAFQMLKPSETSETQKEGMYCLTMLVKALYSATSYSVWSLSGDMSAHDVIVECSAAGTLVAQWNASNCEAKVKPVPSCGAL